MAVKAAVKARSARARGLRTLQHQTLPAATYYAIDTEVWFRGFIAECAPAGKYAQRWATKDQVHDEAIAWFVEHRAKRPLEPRAARRLTNADLTFWVDSKLMERARRLALREDVKLAHLIEAALTAYVRRYVPEELTAFRRRVQTEACSLYDARDTPAARTARAKMARG